MKRITIFYACLFSAFLTQAQNQGTRIIGSYYSFEKGSTELLYGDNVVLRKEPNTSAPGLDTLFIGTEVKILEKTEETLLFNGFESPWYKVKHGKQVGYILGGLIALDHREIDDVKYLVTMARRNDQYFVRTRVLNPDETYFGHESSLNTDGFYLEVFGNRGLEGIGNMLVIELYAEACGVDGGAIYLFNDGIKLTDAIHIARVADGGAFWFNETITFPTDEDGFEGVVYYERHSGETLDDEMEQTREVINTVVLRWKNGQFYPNVDEMDFGND
jgi:hypothetical protein